MRPIVGLFMLTVLLAPSLGEVEMSGSNVAPTDTTVAELRRRVPTLLEQHAVPGLSIAFVRGDSVQWSAGFGTTRTGAGIPVTAQTVFEAASLSKPVFALLVLRLVEEGVLDLNTPLHQYRSLPEGSDPRLRDVTARHVLAHMTGLPNWVRGDTLRLDHAPGTEWQYSGEGYVYLQHTVEHLTGASLPALAQRWIFEPLRMTQSSYLWRSAYDTTAATGHDTSGVPQDKIRPSEETVDRYGAAATLHTTAQDYARFLRAMLPDETAAFDRDSFLCDSLRRAMFMPVVEVEPELGLSWGLGWGLEALDGAAWVFHWGANPHFRTFAMGSRRRNLAFVVLTNGAQGLKLMDEIAAIVTGRGHPLFSFYLLHPTD